MLPAKHHIGCCSVLLDNFLITAGSSIRDLADFPSPQLQVPTILETCSVVNVSLVMQPVRLFSLPVVTCLWRCREERYYGRAAALFTAPSFFSMTGGVGSRPTPDSLPSLTAIACRVSISVQALARYDPYANRLKTGRKMSQSAVSSIFPFTGSPGNM